MSQSKANGGSVSAPAILVGRDDVEDVVWSVATEVPVAFVYNGNTHAVMLATPAELKDYAYGFSYCENIIDDVADIKALEIRHKDKGIDILITLSDERLERFLVRKERRSLVGTSSCGLCGVDSVESLFNDVVPVAIKPMELRHRKVIAAIADFQQKQPIRRDNRSVHGAGWVNGKGSVKLVREDVGRHNALDKLIGAMLLAEVSIGKGYCVVSSRASYELVAKAVRMKMPALVCLSAPTDFAIRTAAAANLTLCNWTRDGLVVF
jgi:FdhD protein